MTTINQLSTQSPLTSGDLLIIYSNNNSDARKISVNTLDAYMQANLEFGSSDSVSQYGSQYASPLTGAIVQVTDSSANTHLILTPAGTISTLTVTLPSKANLVNKQTVLVTSTQIVTTLTVDANGAGSVVGQPTAFAANGFFTLKYDSILDAWRRVS